MLNLKPSKFPLRNSTEIFYSNIYPDLNEINVHFFLIYLIFIIYLLWGQKKIKLI